MNDCTSDTRCLVRFEVGWSKGNPTDGAGERSVVGVGEERRACSMCAGMRGFCKINACSAILFNVGNRRKNNPA